MRSRWLAVAGAVAAVIAIYLQFFRPPAAPPFDSRGTVLVADFVNTTGDAVFDDGLRQVVAMLLQQTPYITLLPDQRAERALMSLQRQPGEPIAGALARDVCQRAGAKVTIDGTIAAAGTGYDIGLAAHNCQTGAALAERHARAAAKDGVLAALGGVVTDLRRRLGETAASIQQHDVQIADAATGSLEALRAYGLANKTRAVQGDDAAVPFLKQALAADPTFALAYAKLGVVSANTGRIDDSRTYAQKAYELRAKVSEYERHYIDWNHATRVLQDPKAAYDALRALTTAYPRDFAARNNLGVYYLGRGQYEEALREYLAAVDIAPDEPLPLANAAYALMFLGRLDEAFQMVDRSLAIRASGGLAIARWVTAFLSGHPRAAEFEATARQMAMPRQIVAAEASLALWRGQIGAYAKLEDQLRAQAREAKDDEWLAGIDTDVQLTRAVYQGGAFIEPLKQWVAAKDNPGRAAQSAAVLAALGVIPPVRAALPALEDAAKTDEPARLPTAIARAYVKAADGQTREATADLQAALNEFPQALDLNYYIGRIREQAGDLKGAETSYRTVVGALPVLGLNPSVSAARLALAEALVKDGDAAGAKEQLDLLLKQWKDADTEFALLKRAKDDRGKIK